MRKKRKKRGLQITRICRSLTEDLVRGPAQPAQPSLSLQAPDPPLMTPPYCPL